jgi:SAM-dependent methyltransferase
MNDFDNFAEAYVSQTEENSFNALYERPAIRSLLPSVNGLHVLDAGCSGGAHSQWLVEQGARVTAMDVSAQMVRLARERLGTRAHVLQKDLRSKLDFLEDGSVDVVFSSLTLHYLERWEPTLQEFHRLLAPSGLLVFSTHHPFADQHWLAGGNYFQTAPVEQFWSSFGESARVRFYRRPLEAIFAALADTGFVVERLLEPRPVEALRDRDPETHARLSREPWFLAIQARRRP